MWPFIVGVGDQAALIHKVFGAGPGLVSRGDPVHDHWFGDQVSGTHASIQGSAWILEDHLHVTAELTKRFAWKRRKVGSIDVHTSGTGYQESKGGVE